MEQHEKVQQQPAGDMSVGEWLITMLIMIIPIVNIVMLFVWGFGSPDKRRNYARASLIWMAISIVLIIIFYGAIFAIIFSTSSF
ncbi:hypothetical protein [Psychrobacillus sp. OK032]|uniref:hypothetical protein n=1 Tax=Psychrobacillus sp. OK032 TaxID=1884358 RepID=UPI0008B1195C|nr:hypothetical protein [Psychrobacillus sp. OK032]SES22786.1 hypothetical protein SAMN05518872_10611 [Psychrobacillus sp. OK032]